MYKLYFFRQGHPLCTCKLDANNITTVGRGAGNTVCFADMTVSRKQFSIECQAGKWILRDLSGRGTYVNGSLIEEIELEIKAIIMFGGHLRAFFINNEMEENHYSTTEIQYGM